MGEPLLSWPSTERKISIQERDHSHQLRLWMTNHERSLLLKKYKKNDTEKNDTESSLTFIDSNHYCEPSQPSSEMSSEFTSPKVLGAVLVIIFVITFYLSFC